MSKILFTEKQIYSLQMARWKARTDLGWLCREILGYKDVVTEVHGPVIDTLQKFPVPVGEQFYKNDVWTGSTWKYTPLRPMQRLEGKRRVLILDPRGHLKTTINAQAHAIQWILNYPDITMAIFQSNVDKAELILKEIKNHFQFNEKFRALFPEHCPQKRILDFGTINEFTTCARATSVMKRESTIMAFSIEKGTAGLHFDVMKFSDIVEPENVKTPERIDAVKKSFYIAENLLVSPSYWIDVEGTRYTFSDLYGDLIKQWLEEEKAGKPHEYTVHVRSVMKRLDGLKYQTHFTPETLNEDKFPFALDENGDQIPWWPQDASGEDRFTLYNLKAMEERDAYIYSCQQNNDPRGGIDGQLIFEIGKNKPVRITQALFKKNVRIVRYTVTVDTAETVNRRSNYSAFVVCGWDGSGMCWLREIVHGKFLPEDLESKFLYLNKKYKPESFKVEKTGFVRGLAVALQRTMDLTGNYLPIEFVPRENQAAKTERIYNTLNPWYSNNWIRLVDPEPDDTAGWAAYTHLITELKTFPLGTSDDILDALADQFQDKDWYGRETARPTVERELDLIAQRWLKVENPFDLENADYLEPNPSGYSSITGGL